MNEIFTCLREINDPNGENRRSPNILIPKSKPCCFISSAHNQTLSLSACWCHPFNLTVTVKKIWATSPWREPAEPCGLVQMVKFYVTQALWLRGQ